MATIASTQVEPPRTPEPELSSARASRRAHHSVDVLRIGLGVIFLWAFLDKTFGLGYSTGSGRAWIHGGSPTKGFLGHVEVGPLQSAFRSIAGAGWADWLFMIALLGLGVALLAGVALRISAVAGTVLLVLMWVAEWPLAQHTSTGDPSGSANPFLDYHLMYAAGLIVVATLGIASAWGMDRWWSKLPVVASHPILR